MPLSAPVEGFRLAYDRTGDGPPAVLLHGWPGCRGDYRDVVPLLAPEAGARRRGYGPGSTPVMRTALPATPASIV